LVVQTLRNWIVSATFLASTAILFALGIMGAA
jgi:Flp pilus assembly protein protease CpaA